MLEEMPEFQIPRDDSTPTAPSPDVEVMRASSLWDWRDLVLFLGFALVALVLTYVLVIVGYAALTSLIGGRLDPNALQHDTVLNIAFQMVLYGLLFGFLYFLVAVYHNRPFWSSFKLRKLTRRQVLGYIAGGFFVAVGVQFAPTLLPDKQDFPLEQMFTSPQVALALGVFATLIAPFMEELIFRGFLFSIFERQVGLLVAVIATAVLFALPHIPEYRGAWNHLLLVFLAGLVFSLTRGLTGSLTPSIVLHSAYNLTLMTGLFFATQHFRNLGFIVAR